MSMAMKVPVRPMPALQCTATVWPCEGIEGRQHANENRSKPVTARMASKTQLASHLCPGRQECVAHAPYGLAVLGSAMVRPGHVMIVGQHTRPTLGTD